MQVSFYKKKSYSFVDFWDVSCTAVLMIFPDRFGDGDWRLSSEGEPAVSADATPQDHPCSLFGATEEAGVSGLCCQGSGPKWLSRGPKTEVICFHLSVWKTQAWKKKKRLFVEPHPSLLTSNFTFFLSCSFAGGTWDWEYLGFASPEVIKPISMMFLLFGPVG